MKFSDKLKNFIEPYYKLSNEDIIQEGDIVRPLNLSIEYCANCKVIRYIFDKTDEAVLNRTLVRFFISGGNISVITKEVWRRR